MKKHIKQRIISLAASAALTCSLCSNILQVLAEDLSYSQISYSDSELVDVIVKLKGSSVLAAPEANGKGSDYIDTQTARSAEESLQTSQKKAEKHIRKLYPELEIRYRFTLTANGFSCTIPESLIPQIENDPLIESVSEVNREILPEPQLTTAAEFGGINKYSNTTGFSGEGEVIAIIDTEFDLSHGMFAPMEGKDVKISKENITELSNKYAFSSKVNPEKVYVSNKIPFAYDYSDDTPYTLSAPLHYHGTHISGIAAGNKVKLSDGSEMSGIAPDAQLLMMKVYGNQTGDESGIYKTSDEFIAAAIEDAVKLKADVINMSFGRIYEYYNQLFYADSIDAAINAGITICAPAGNASNDRLGLGRRTTPDQVDTGNISEPSIFPHVFSVASANNIIHSTNNILKSGELEISYCECGSKYCNEVLADKEYEIVYVTQIETQMNKEEISGKIVAFSGSNDEYTHLEQKCLANEAAGIIIADDSFSGMKEGFLYTTAFPVAVISKNDYSELKENNIKSISFTSQQGSIIYEQTISNFSSFGVDTSLNLKPEITGIGGNVLSAAYDNSTGYMSGTSMASPYIAGCVALYDQYMNDNNIKLTGLEKTQMIKNILMNTAIPMCDDGIPLSPRQQGAGLVALDKVTDTNVIMTGTSGKAAIELHDGLEDLFSFELNISNLGSEDVTYSSSNITLTSDNYEYNEITKKNFISGQTLLFLQHDLESDITVPAGKTITKTVSVSLDAAQRKALSEVFVNGFFVEGYISLYGAENSCDISIPIIGFYGDWCSIPTIDVDRYPVTPKVSIGINELRTDVSFAKAADMIKKIVIDDTYLMNLDPEFPDQFPLSADYLFTSEQKEQFYSLNDEVTYFSPNKDVIADYMGCYYVPTREATFSNINLYNKDGSLIYDTGTDKQNSFETKLALLPDDAYSLPDGKYHGAIESYINYGNSKENKQSYPVDICIDTVPPSVSYDIIEENGKQFLKLTASDTSLDGIYIMGQKIGRASNNSLASFNALGLTQRTLSHDSYQDNNNNNSIFTNYPANNQNYILSDFQSILTGMIIPPGKDYNYCDIIPAEPDENGDFTITYDITNIAEYSITVVDRAFNEYCFHSNNPNPINFAEGLWRGINEYSDKYYEFYDNGTVAMINTIDKSHWFLDYTYEDNKIKFLYYDDATVTWINPYEALLSWEHNQYKELLKFEQESISNEKFAFYSDEELMALAKNYYYLSYGLTPKYSEISVDSENGNIYIRLYDFQDDKEKEYDVYTVSRTDATGIDSSGKEIDLKEATQINKEGVWTGFISTPDLISYRYFNFTEINNNTAKGKYADQSDGIEHDFSCTFNGKTIEFSFDSFNDTPASSRTATICYTYSPKEIELKWDNGLYEKLTYNDDFISIREIGFLTNNKLINLSHNYYTRTHEIEPSRETVEYTGLINMVKISIFINNSEGSEVLDEEYTVDIISGKGVDLNGQEIDLLNQPSNLRNIKGVWKGVTEDCDKYFDFFEDGFFKLLNTSDNTWYEIKYTIIGDEFTLYDADNHISNEGTISWISDYEALITWKYDNYRSVVESLSLVSEEYTLEDLAIYSDQELSELAINYFYNNNGFKPEYTRLIYNSENETISIELYSFLNGKEEKSEVYTVKRETAMGYDTAKNTVDLKEAVQFSKTGVWSAFTPTMGYNNPRFFNILEYDSDSAKGVYAYQSDGIEHEFTCTFEGNTVIFSFDSYENTIPTRRATIIAYNANLITLIWDNQFYEYLTYQPFMSEINETNFLTNDALLELSKTYFINTTNCIPAKQSISYTADKDYVYVYLYLNEDDEYNEFAEFYKINFITGKGMQSDGTSINIFDNSNNEYMLGDPNGDKRVDSKDASEILIYYAKTSTGEEVFLSKNQLMAANVIDDDKIDARDASAILGYYSYISTGGKENFIDYLNSSESA